MKLAKKTLSLFLSLLMIFSACSVGLTGITASAAAGDSKYQASEVVDALNKLVAQGYSAKSSGNATNIAGDNGVILAAAEAVFDYAVKTYREGRKPESGKNSADTLYNAFIAEFSGYFTNATALNAVKAFAKDILYPAGTTVYGYENRKTGSYTYTDSNTGYWEDCDYLASKGTDVTEYSQVQNSYNTAVVKTTINKSVDITVDIDKYLQSYAVIEDIPSSFLTSVSYDYSHAYGRYAEVTNTSLKKTSASWGRTKYTKTTNVTTWAWNYMSAKPVRVVEKNTTAKKYLLSLEKYYNEELLALTQADLLAKSVAEIERMYTEAQGFYTMATENFSDATLTHFGFGVAAIDRFMADLEFAYRVIIGKHSIDTLNQYIGSEYNKDSYAEMSSLYTKVSTAYNVVDTIDTDVLNFILNEYDYTDEYASVDLAASKAYIDELYDIMTEQRLEELVASMTATYDAYYALLDKENIEVPSDAEVIGLVQKVDAYNSVLALYPGYDYYRTYYTTEQEAAWNDFCAKLSEVAEVRGLKADFQTYYSFFMPIIFTNMIVDLSNDAAVDLHEDIETRLEELKQSYSDVKAAWGDTIANKIFTINYEGTDYLLQDLIEKVKSTGLELLKQNLIDRTVAQLDTVLVYKDVTVVNFDNFAEIKSTLSHFDYDLYDYVNGQGWLDATQTGKYDQVAVLLEKYKAFSTTDGKAFFDEDFTFADANGNYAIREAGNQVVTGADGGEVQIGYPNDIARNGAEDNYYVNEQIMLDTVAKIDGFITHRDFGALVGFVDVETEEPTDLKTFVNQMLADMLYTDEFMNTIVGAIFPMLVELINTELIGAISNLSDPPVSPRDPNANAAIDVGAMSSDLEGSGIADLYIDDAKYNGKQYQRYLSEAFASLGLYIYPTTLADSLAISNPSFYGKDSEIYKALKAAGRDWSLLVSEDDPETLDVDETKILEFAWGVYDKDSFLETLACVLDPLLPLLQTALAGAAFSDSASNAAYATIEKIKYSIFSVNDVAAYGDLVLKIDPLYLYADLIVPLFQALGVENIPTLKPSCGSDDIVNAIFGTLLDRVDEILDSPLTSILEILPNLVYFLSMDSVQEIIDGLVLNLNLAFELEIDSSNSGVLATILGFINIEGLINDMLVFDLPLNIAEMLDLYDLLGFEITNFNEVLNFLLPTLGLDIQLPHLKQQEIIFCSDWSTRADGSVNLVSNKGDLLYWLLDYIISAIADGTLIDALLGSAGEENDEEEATPGLGEGALSGAEIDLGDPMLNNLIDRIVGNISHNQDDALAAIVELLNPVTYDLTAMEWNEQGAYDYNGIEGADQMSIVYLNYGNDWTREKSEYLLDNADALVSEILAMTGSEIEDLGTMLQDTVNGLFTNANITALVEMLGGFGDSPSGVIEDVVKNQVGIDIKSWFTAFGYLYPVETWAEDAEIIEPGNRNYVNNFGVEGIANEDGTISWFFNRMPLVDGDGYTFINILSRLLGEASLVIEFLFAGEDIAAFNDLLTLKGYETYDTSIGLLLEMLGVENLPTQADFNADAMGSFTNMLMATLDWFYAFTDSDTMVAQLVELIPDVFYFIECNGLSTLLHNLLMPVLVLVDTARPLMDIDINGVLSLIVSEFLNYGTLNTDVLLNYIVSGVYMNDDWDYKYYSVDINNLTVSEIIKILDQYMGTNLYESGLVQVGVMGYCSGIEKVENTAVGTVYKSTVDAADAITILVTALLDCLDAPAADTSKTNGDAIFAFIAELTENEEIAGYYPVISDLIKGVEVEYTDPNWGYMFDNITDFSLTLPEQSIVYLGYTTDWTEETADSVYDSLDEIVNMILESSLEEGETIATLINGLLEDNVYSDEILNTLVELIVNAIAMLDGTLADLIDVVITTDISAWFTMCEETVDEEGNTVYVCTKDWGIDAAAEADKKDLFIAGLKEVLTPANALLAWLFFGEEFAFFTGSQTDAEGNYVYNDIIKLNGGEGYAYGIAPILEALGCEMAPASAYYDDATGTYNTADAVEAILDSVFALVDEISANPVEEVFTLLPNIIYFVNADGLKTSVTNLLAPVNGIIETLSPIISEDGSTVSLGALLEETIGLNIENITTEVLLGFAEDAGVQISPEILAIICELYVGNLVEFTAANGHKAYRLDVTGYEGDILTIILSIAIDLFNLNGVLFSDLLGTEVYTAIVTLLKGLEVNFIDMNWAYMYDGDLDKLNNAGFPEQTIDYLGYTTDWDKETAEAVYEALDEIVAMVLESSLEEGENIATLINGLLEDNVYTDAILNSLVELIVNGLANLDAAIYEAAGAVLDADIATWFSFCEQDAEGEYVCTKNWGVDAAAEADKKDVFVAGIKEVLEPANTLLSWLFFGEEYTLFNGTTDEVLVTINGGQGYAYGLVPIFEALGCTMQPASAFYNAETDTYNVGDAVESILDAALALVDTISGNVAEEAMKLLPNLIYFINAEGLKASVQNLLAPVNVVVECLNPVIGDFSIGGLLTDLAGFDVENITMDSLLTVLNNELGFVVNDEMAYVLKNLYVGEPTAFDSASGRTAYRVAYTDDAKAYDMLTILISFALDAFNLNDAMFSDLLGAETYAAIVTLIKGLDIEANYIDMNWAYMYDGDLDKLNNAGFPEQTIDYLGYTTDWDEETAESVYNALDEVLELVLDSTLDEGENIATLINGLLEDNVYTDEILNSLVELIVNGIANLDAAIYEAAGTVLDADIATWFSFCEKNAEGEYVCTKNWGVDAAAEADKKDVFVAGIKEVLEPANKLLSWLFFGEQYTLFNGTTNEVLVTINGGQGYAYGLVPIFEALGCTMQPASAFYNAETDTYNVGDAVESILDAALALVDTISGNTVEEAMKLLPNLFYFINAEGLKASVNNLLAPVNVVVECLNPVIGDFSIGELLTDLAGFDVTNITVDTIVAILEKELGFVVNDEMTYVLKNLYVGEPTTFTSVNGRTAYKVAYTDEAKAYEMLTILLSFALDAFNLNPELFSDLLVEETYHVVYELIQGASDEFVYREMNWAYMYEGEDALSKLFNEGFPARTGDAYQVYTKYQNNWNKATADYLDFVLDKLVKDITDAARKDGSSLGMLLDNAITKGLYQDDILNSLIEMLVELLVDYEDIIKQAGALLGAEGLAVWFDDYCEITTDENGETVVTCDKDWGIDAATTNEAKREAFVEGFVEALRPAYRLLAWLLFGEDYTFFNGTTNDVLITIKGGKGYDNGLVPLLEGVSATMNYEGTASGIKPAAAFYVDGELDMEMAVRDVFTAVTDWLNVICGDLAGEGTLGAMLDILPNFLYFVNADGLKVVVNNLLQPVNFILDALKPMGVEVDFATLVDEIDITNVDFYAVFGLLEDLLGLYFPEYTQNFLATFYMGQPVPYTSANGKLAYRMTYSDAEPRRDMITCLISFVVDAFADPRNDACLIDWMGEDIYNGIIAVLGLQGVKDMQNFDWLYTEYADTDYEFNATETSVTYEAAYNNIWTRDKAEYIADNLVPFISNILGLIGLEINGVEIRSVDDLLDSLLENNLYTQATVDSLLEAVRDLVGELTSLEPYGEYITGILNTAFGVDLTAWDTMNLVVEDGNRDSFVAALEEMLVPVVPLLNVLLCGENIELFYSIEPENVGESAVVIYGSEGYAYGIVPLFEALGCTMMAPEEFKALSNEDKVGAILDSLLDRVDVILLDPVNEIFAMLPELIYFINSNGLDTSVNNILNSVDTVLIALEPIVGATSLMELLGVNLAEYDMNYIINLACEAISESTGLDCEPVIVDFVAELTMGKVISYQSANGETYYKMVYAGENQLADMVTVLLRLIIDFLATGDNADAVIALIAGNSESEDAANSASTLINFVLTAANTEPMTSGAMATLYWIFYGLNNGVEGLDYLYGNYGESWDALVGFFEENDETYLEKAADVLKAILKEFAGIDTDSNVDCNCSCHSNSSFIRFFFNIINFIRKLFGMKDYQYCECGAAHW